MQNFLASKAVGRERCPVFEENGHLKLLPMDFIFFSVAKESMMADWRFQVPRLARRRHRHDCVSARVRDGCDAEYMTTMRCLMIVRFLQAAVSWHCQGGWGC